MDRQETEPAPLPDPKRWRWRLLAVALIVGVAGFRLYYLAHDCPLDLAPDEAHYWDWSRHLDWSYYSKGPLVAYLIRAGCELAGAWSQRLMASEMLAVRLPAVLCGSLLLVSLYVLTTQVFRREALALGVVALALTLPIISAGSSLMTIDAPYTCCWGWALVLGHYAIGHRSTWAWLAAGLVVGLGILAKYTMVLWLPSLGLYLLTSREHRALLLRPGLWLLTLVAAVCCLPILIWNSNHGWMSFWHVFYLAGAADGPKWHWQGPLVYVGVQFALLLGFWFVAWASAMIARPPWREADAGVRYLWWMSAPMFGVFLLFSPKNAGGEPNWPVTAYISGLVLAGGWLAMQLRSTVAWYRRLSFFSVAVACGLGLLLSVMVHHSEWFYPVLTWVAGRPSPAHFMPLRRFDPTCRLKGWRTLAAEVDRARARLRATGIEPVLAASSWALPGELGFYCEGHPTVYSVGPAIGDRHSQYDLWHPNPIDDVEAFAGRTFIIVAGGEMPLANAFERVETSQVVVHSHDGQPLACWFVTVAHGFRGFPKLPEGQGRKEF
jgi:4-amino-4-deoxy-L-arabinose transferase-like glycosyltransferase